MSTRVATHLRHPPLPHLLELRLDLELPGLVLHFFELLLGPQLLVKLGLLLLSNLASINVRHLRIPQQIQALLPLLLFPK